LTLQPLKGKALQSFADANARLNIWDGSVSSGKTITSLFPWVDFILNGPAGEILMVGKTERTLKRNVINPMVQIYGNRNIDTRGMGRGEIRIFGRRIYLVGANDERAEQKIRGLSLVGAYVDEITILPESFFVMLLTRLRMPGARLYGTTNPDGPYHWLKVNFIDKNIRHLKRFHFTLDDNPYLDPEYVAARKTEFTGLFYRRFILGEWCLAEGSVYDMWDEKAHVIPKPVIPAKDYIVSVDYGTNNPCAFLLIAIHEKGATVEKEYYYDAAKTNRQKTDAEYSRDLKEFIGTTRPRAIIIDPSALSFKVQLRNDGFFNLKDADNEVLDGIRTVASMISGGRLNVCACCENLIKEMGSYIWDKKAQAKGEDKPMKQHDHALDALRYGIHTTFSKPAAPAVLRRFGL
jgi:PBSX family phage terminase large subunit